MIRQWLLWKHRASRSVLGTLLISAMALAMPVTAHALTSATNPQNSAIGLEGTITSPPPSTAPSISIPTNGQSFTTEPVTVSGLCKNGLLVKVFSNGVFIGAAQCANGSFSIQAALFSGQNQLVARQYDALDQASPDSNTITVSFVSTVTSGAPSLTLTSAYAERGANPGADIAWPMAIAGGIAPYAISVDWGDGSASELISQKTPGNFTATHAYAQAGIYKVLVRASDQSGQLGYLQLVGVGNGAAQSTQSATNNQKPTTTTKILWQPALGLIPLSILAFWLGRRAQLAELRRRLEQN